MRGDEVMVDERMVELFPDVAAIQDPHGFHYLVSPSQAPAVGGMVMVKRGGGWLWGRVVRRRGVELMVDTYDQGGLVYSDDGGVAVVVGLVTAAGVTVPDPNLRGVYGQ